MQSQKYKNSRSTCSSASLINTPPPSPDSWYGPDNNTGVPRNITGVEESTQMVQGEGRKAGRLSSATSGENTPVSTRTHAKCCSCSTVISYVYVICSYEIQYLHSSLSFYTHACFILYVALLLIFCILFFVYFA